MADKIKVFVRLRPVVNEGAADLTNSYDKVLDYTEHRICPLQGKDAERGSKGFLFQKIFAPACSNANVFGELQEITTAALDGKSGTILAYGQTATGKTHTMRGCAQDPGVSERLVAALFDEMATRPQWRYRVEVAYFEIHNEKVFDLLSGSVKELEVRCDSVVGLHQEPAATAEAANDALLLGEENRRKAKTDMNEHSSRSHTIFRVSISAHMQGKTRASVLHLVDLAGSENAKSAGYTDGSTAREGGAINRSLLALTNVIHSLAERQQHVNYRDSKLTRLLSHSLGGTAQTYLICCVTAAKRYFSETMSTLNFANRARVVYNSVKVNETDGSWTVSWEAHSHLHQMHIDDLADAERREKQIHANSVATAAQVMRFACEEFQAESELFTELDYAMQKQCHELSTQVQELRTKLSSASETFIERQASLEGEVAMHISSSEEMKQRVATCEAAMQAAKEAAKTHASQASKGEKELKEVRRQVQDASKQMAQLRKEKEEAEGKLHTSKAALASLQEEAQANAKRADEYEVLLSHAETPTTTPNAEMAALLAKLHASEARATQLQKNLTSANATIEDKDTQLSKAAATAAANAERMEIEIENRKRPSDGDNDTNTKKRVRLSTEKTPFKSLSTLQVTHSQLNAVRSAPVHRNVVPTRDTRNEAVLRKIEDITCVLNSVGLVKQGVMDEIQHSRDAQAAWPTTARHVVRSPSHLDQQVSRPLRHRSPGNGSGRNNLASSPSRKTTKSPTGSRKNTTSPFHSRKMSSSPSRKALSPLSKNSPGVTTKKTKKILPL